MPTKLAITNKGFFMDMIAFYRNLVNLLGNSATVKNSKPNNEEEPTILPSQMVEPKHEPIRPNEDGATIKHNENTLPDDEKYIYVEIGREDSLLMYKKAVSSGMKEIIGNNRVELTKEMNVLTDEYMEYLCNLDYDDDGIAMDKRRITRISNLITGSINEFVTSYLKDVKGNENIVMADVTEKFMSFAENKINDYATKQAKSLTNIQEMGNQESHSFENLQKTVKEAELNNYLTQQEAKNIKSKTTDCIFTQLLNGNIENGLLLSLNPTYKNNINYINAMNKIKEGQRFEQIGDYINAEKAYNEAKSGIEKMINIISPNVLTEKIKDYGAAPEEPVTPPKEPEKPPVVTPPVNPPVTTPPVTPPVTTPPVVTPPVEPPVTTPPVVTPPVEPPVITPPVTTPPVTPPVTTPPTTTPPVEEPTTPKIPAKPAGMSDKSNYDETEKKWITAESIAYFGICGPSGRYMYSFIRQCNEYPNIYEPFETAGLIRKDEKGQYVIADEAAVKRFFGDDKSISMEELRSLIIKDTTDFDPELIKAFIANQPEPLTTAKQFIDKVIPEEGLTPEEFIQLFKEYPDFFQPFIDLDMMSLENGYGQSDEPHLGIFGWYQLTGFTKNADGEYTHDTVITKDDFERVMTDGQFDIKKLMKCCGIKENQWDKEKDEIRKEHERNKLAADKFLEYYATLSEESKQDEMAQQNVTYRYVMQFVNNYNKAINALSKRDIFDAKGMLQYYLQSSGQELYNEIKLKYPFISL